MNRTIRIGILAALSACSLVNIGGAETYELDPVFVTAQRVENRDLDTPATVEVVERKDIEASGAGSAFEVLRTSLGTFASTQLPNGVSMGSMTSKINIRGVDKGTLVLVDGVPMNQDGKYNLEDIGADAIERIEIVRGGGSMLYGSEATGGVINIITRSRIQTVSKWPPVIMTSRDIMSISVRMHSTPLFIMNIEDLLTISRRLRLRIKRWAENLQTAITTIKKETIGAFSGTMPSMTI